MGSYPSSNIPSVQSIQEKILAAAERASKRNVTAPFYNQANLSQLAHVANLEAANRQEDKEKFKQAQLETSGNINFLSPNRAGEEARRRFASKSQLQADQTAAQATAGASRAEENQARYADTLSLRSFDVELQNLMQQAKQNFHREMANAKMAYQRDRDKLQYDLAVKNADRNYRATVWGAKMKEISLSSRLAESREGISASRQRRGALYGGGGGMTASYSSGAGNFKDHLRSMGVMG